MTTMNVSYSPEHQVLSWNLQPQGRVQKFGCIPVQILPGEVGNLFQQRVFPTSFKMDRNEAVLKRTRIEEELGRALLVFHVIEPDIAFFLTESQKKRITYAFSCLFETPLPSIYEAGLEEALESTTREEFLAKRDALANAIEDEWQAGQARRVVVSEHVLRPLAEIIVDYAGFSDSPVGEIKTGSRSSSRERFD